MEALRYIGRHILRRNHVVLELGIGIWRRDTAKDPEKIDSVETLGLHADAASAAAGYKGLFLNVRESRSRRVAAKDVRIRAITHCNDRHKSSTAKLSGNEELARVGSIAFVMTV
jgi:hypothetical protein